MFQSPPGWITLHEAVSSSKIQEDLLWFFQVDFLLLLIHRQNVLVFVSFLSMSEVILVFHTLYIINLLLLYSVLILTQCLRPVVWGGYKNLNKWTSKQILFILTAATDTVCLGLGVFWGGRQVLKHFFLHSFHVVVHIPLEVAFGPF